jgi:hypothetical protein
MMVSELQTVSTKTNKRNFKPFSIECFDDLNVERECGIAKRKVGFEAGEDQAGTTINEVKA